MLPRSCFRHAIVAPVFRPASSPFDPTPIIPAVYPEGPLSREGSAVEGSAFAFAVSLVAPASCRLFSSSLIIALLPLLSSRAQSRGTLFACPFGLDGERVYQMPAETRTRETQLFLAHQIQVGVAAHARIHHRREIARIIVGVAAGEQRECKGKLQRHLGWPISFPSCQPWR